MPYDHSTKIGNQGDVVKHVALFASLRRLLDGWPEGREFVYADIHAGRPAYVLPAKGEWQYGVGPFSEKSEVVEDRKRRRKGPSLLGAAGAFDATFLGQSVTPGITYPGSSGIAFRLLGATKLPWRMKLWEKERQAADDIEAHFRSCQDRVKVVCGDGYEVVKDEAPFSLVLIDPPALEAAAVLETMANLNGRGIPFLCWTPRTSCSVKPTTPDGEWSAAEAGTSTDYIQAAAKCGSCLRVQWQPWGCRTPGCCITVSAGLSGVVSAAVKQVTLIMGWQLEE
jgi:hypothetical protein